MKKPVKQDNTTTFSLRADAQELRLAVAIATMRGETLSEILRRAIREYISLHKDDLLASLTRKQVKK